MKSIYVFFITVLCILLLQNISWAETKSSGSFADYGISGDAELLSHYIVRGLSYSDYNPSMNASFMANLGTQFKLGFWGTNISNLDAVDDNFWLKIVAEIKTELSSALSMNILLADNHFYKSSQRNGQSMSLKFDYIMYEFGLDWLGNFEGTKSNAEYLWAGKLFDFRKIFNYGGFVGYTNTHSAEIQGYFDFKVIAQYTFKNNSYAEAGITANSNSSQFGTRDDPAFYIGLKLSY